MGDVRETLELVVGHTDELDEMKEQLKDYVEKNEALEAMIEALKEQVVELMGELNNCKAALGSAMLVSVPKKCSMDVPKPKEFKGTWSARDVDTFL
ncbi:hypothetical protein Gorai_014701 [Gossypium raimondii]|uniref:Uncharacterized protein n=1 Tax=Gossypium raimondii TaxID=29730 RepID=A0A7J8P488_GOSRA|nr:hypothetical protein [Gossypium raimondii]